MVKVLESQFNPGDIELYAKSWLPDDSTPTVAKLAFIHGFSDHINSGYPDGLFPALADAGIAVYGFDQRGWGRSVRKPAERGLTGPTDQVLADIAAFITNVAIPAAPGPATPLFVMGHSMGGGEVLALASTPAYEESVVRHVRGWLLEAPFVAFDERERPGALKVIAGRLAGRVLPRMQLKNAIPPEYLSRDPAVVARLRDDPLCHDTATLEGAAGLLDRTADLAEGRYRLSGAVRSLWFGHGDRDIATSYPESKRWCERQTQVADRTFKTYEGWLHQLHADEGKEEFFRDVRDWILQRCGEDGGAVGKGEAKVESKL